MRFVAFVLSALLSFAAWAQAYPNRPVKVVVPYAAGGLPDTMARLVGQKLGESLGQQMVVENRGGAGGIVGTTEVAKAAPDGYTLLVADVTQIAVNPHLFANLPYEPLKELTGVSLLGTSPLYLVAHPSLAANDMKELIALVRSQPGRISYGSSGLGSIHHLAMEALKTGLKLDMVHVPYKGTGQSVPALPCRAGGRVPSCGQTPRNPSASKRTTTQIQKPSRLRRLRIAGASRMRRRRVSANRSTAAARNGNSVAMRTSSIAQPRTIREPR